MPFGSYKLMFTILRMLIWFSKSALSISNGILRLHTQQHFFQISIFKKISRRVHKIWNQSVTPCSVQYGIHSHSYCNAQFLKRQIETLQLWSISVPAYLTTKPVVLHDTIIVPRRQKIKCARAQICNRLAASISVCSLGQSQRFSAQDTGVTLEIILQGSTKW